MSFFDSEVSGGLDELRIVAWQDNTLLWDEIFTDAAAAEAFLGSGLIALADASAISSNADFRVTFDLDATEPDATFRTGFLLSLVPEPSTGVLVQIGLLLAVCFSGDFRRGASTGER